MSNGIRTKGRPRHSPERRPIGLVIQDAHAGIPATGEVVPDDRNRAGVSPGALQQPAVFPDNLPPIVPGQLEEALAGEDDGAVRQIGVREDEVRLALGERLHGLVGGGHQLQC